MSDSGRQIGDCRHGRAAERCPDCLAASLSQVCQQAAQMAAALHQTARMAATADEKILDAPMSASAHLDELRELVRQVVSDPPTLMSEDERQLRAAARRTIQRQMLGPTVVRAGPPDLAAATRLLRALAESSGVFTPLIEWAEMNTGVPDDRQPVFLRAAEVRAVVHWAEAAGLVDRRACVCGMAIWEHGLGAGCGYPTPAAEPAATEVRLRQALQQISEMVHTSRFTPLDIRRVVQDALRPQPAKGEKSC